MPWFYSEPAPDFTLFLTGQHNGCTTMAEIEAAAPFPNDRCFLFSPDGADGWFVVRRWGLRWELQGPPLMETNEEETSQWRSWFFSYRLCRLMG